MPVTKLRTLYHKGKHGELRQWRVWAEGDLVKTEYGVVGGAMQESQKRAKPKNVGRSNSTCGEAQALVEAAALYKFKLTRKYSLTPAEAQEQLLLPMLAHPYKSKDAKLPCNVQPKLDGVRCLAENKDGVVTLYSRSGKVYDIKHISEWLEMNMPDDSILDGEIYIHGETLQSINSLVKRPRHESCALEYHVYDVPRLSGEEDKVWSARLEDLRNLLFDAPKKAPVKMVVTVTATSEWEVVGMQKALIEEGYEGAIIRNFDGMYLFGYRSHDLLKMKTFTDDEFVVTGATGGEGKYEKCVIWECLAKNGKKFNAVPKGTQAMREKWLTTADKYFGRKLTVRYFTLTPDGIPFHGVGVAFRLDEDLPA